MTNYKAGQREFDRWLRDDHGFRIIRIVDKGLQRNGDGWDHFAWTMGVTSQHTAEVYEFPYMAGTAHKGKPTLIDMIGALLSDAGCATGSFQDFCADLGYDDDSVKVRNLFDQILVNNGRLLRLFGATSLDALLSTVASRMEAAGL